MVYAGKSYIEHPPKKLTFTSTQVGIPCKWVNDTQCLLLGWFEAICGSPSQIYHSALPLSPSSTWVRNCYSAELSGEVKVVKGLPAEWGTCFRTVALKSHSCSLACWKDIIAVGLSSGKIVVLNGTTGRQAAILSSHTQLVGSLTFSLDGTSLVSGSHDATIKLWDMQTGGVVKTFCSNTISVWSVSISPDFTTIASAAFDGEIQLWDIQTGECNILTNQQSLVECVTFSPINSQYLISISDGKVQQWDIDGHKISHSYDGSYAAFSSDGTQLVLCQGADIVVQDSDSRAIGAKFHIPDFTTYECCFSPDGRLVAVAAEDMNVYVWDITGSDPHLVETIVGHPDRITSFAFSSPSSLITSSWGGIIKFWKISVMSTDPVMGHPKPIPFPSAPFSSITLHAKDNIFASNDSDGRVKTWDISTGLCKTSLQTPAMGNHQSDLRLVDGRLTLVWHADEKIHIWDVEREVLLQEIHTLWPDIHDIRISGDGTKVFCLHEFSIRAWCIQTGELVGEVKNGSYLDIMSLIVDNGSGVWVHYQAKRGYPGWNFGITDSPPSHTSSLYVSDTKKWDVGLSRIKDKNTGKVVLHLGGKFTDPVDMQSDGSYLLAFYESGEALILDFNDVCLQ